MEAIKLPEMNRELKPPKDWDAEKHGECVPLPVFAEVVNGDMRLTSAWKPAPIELEALYDGQPVLLTIFGTTHPACVVGVLAPPGQHMPLPTLEEQIESDLQLCGTSYVIDGRRVAPDRLQIHTRHDSSAATQQACAQDANCPILALAPGEYTEWEKRVWRRGVCDAEAKREVQAAVRASQDASREERRKRNLDYLRSAVDRGATDDMLAKWLSTGEPYMFFGSEGDRMGWTTRETVERALAAGVPPGTCALCNQPMPPGEEHLVYHGYSGPCPVGKANDEDIAG